MLERYYIEKEKQEKLLSRKNIKSDFYNGIYDRYEYPVLTREHIPLTWRYDLNPKTNPYFMERLGINAVMNSGAIELNGKYYLVARIEGNDRKSFFGVAESDNGVDGFRFWDYPILLDDTCPEETNVYDMRLTKHEDGYIYGVFCSESKDTSVNDLSAAVAAAGIVRTKDLKHWERLENLKTLRSPQQRNVVLHPEFVDGKYAFYTRPMDDFIETGSGGGIGFGLCDDITHAVIDEERMTSLRNGGVFAFRLNYVLQKAHELIEFTDYEDLLAKYETLQKISFDYAVVEKEPEIEVMRFAGTWKDLGTWNTLTEAMDSACVGEAVLNETCRNVHVVNELDMPVLCMGLQDIVVAASPEGILVSDKEQSSYIKPYVSSFTQQVMFAEKSWGSFRIMDVEKESLTIKVTLNPGHKMNYHSHEFRDEVWTVIYGEGRAVIDGEERRVKAGDVLRMPAGCRHMLLADTELQVIEVQLGKDISVQDKKKYPPLKPL